MKEKIRRRLAHIKDNNAWLRLLWLKQLAKRAERERATMNDLDCINKLYHDYCGCYPNLDSPTLFSEKQQWLKLHYRNELMPIVGDKYMVRNYLRENGYGHLLNDLIAVYERVEDFDPSELPDSFVLKASHASGWNLVVKDKRKMHWRVWRKHMRYWLKHDIAWNGREWHYAMMTPRIVCERYLEDSSGGLMDYKLYCMNGEPRFVQVNKGRGDMDSVQNYYDLDWNLLPFGKSQPHNPNVQIDPPERLQEMIDIARELSQPFPYVRMDFYEAESRLYFGEFTFFPCSGMPDFIPSEWDAKVGKMLTLPKANN